MSIQLKKYLEKFLLLRWKRRKFSNTNQISSPGYPGKENQNGKRKKSKKEIIIKITEHKSVKWKTMMCKLFKKIKAD